MKQILFTFLLTSFILTQHISAQTPENERNVPLKAEESLEFIASDLQEIAKTIKSFNKDVIDAYGNISKSLGLKLTENQQKLLVSFEILNRAEVRLSNLQKLKIQLMQDKAKIDEQIKDTESSLKERNIERSITLQGTTRSEELREERRNRLNQKLTNLNNLLFDINSIIADTNGEILETTQIVNTIRRRLFPAIYRELSKLESND